MTAEPGFAASRTLARHARHPDDTRGRRYRGKESAFRTVYRRDRDGIVHAAVFRGPKHETRVFVRRGGGRYRTRPAHGLEVAWISRSPFGRAGMTDRSALDEHRRPFDPRDGG